MEPFLHARRPKHRRNSVYAATLAVPFATLQVWAVLLLLSTVRLSGAAGLAFLLVVAGAVVGAFGGLRWAWRLDSIEPPRATPSGRC